MSSKLVHTSQVIGLIEDESLVNENTEVLVSSINIYYRTICTTENPKYILLDSEL